MCHGWDSNLQVRMPKVLHEHKYNNLCNILLFLHMLNKALNDIGCIQSSWQVSVLGLCFCCIAWFVNNICYKSTIIFLIITKNESRINEQMHNSLLNHQIHTHTHTFYSHIHQDKLHLSYMWHKFLLCVSLGSFS